MQGKKIEFTIKKPLKSNQACKDDKDLPMIDFRIGDVITIDGDKIFCKREISPSQAEGYFTKELFNSFVKDWFKEYLQQ